MLIYRIGESGQQLVFTPTVLNHFAKCQQNTSSAREAGGQLFARFSGDQIRIEHVTGPRATDRRSRFGYVPDRNREQDEIDLMHGMGLHFVGDWHTHLEARPSPSGSDVRSIREAVTMSKHHLNGFLMIIVGTEAFPDGLHISLHGPTEGIKIEPLRN
jgi:integrative and conjugative element protein (TIGR02256 family)